jgi:hypothetical protein
MISQTLSRFSSVPPVEGRPECLQPSTEENYSKFCVLPMILPPKAVMNISGVSNAPFFETEANCNVKDLFFR